KSDQNFYISNFKLFLMAKFSIHKKLFIILILGLILPLLILFTINAKEDFFQILSRSKDTTPIFSGTIEQAVRHQIPSIARYHNNFNTILVGNSRLANVIPSEVEQLLPNSTIRKFPLPGAGFQEISYVTDYILEQNKKVTKVFMIFMLSDLYSPNSRNSLFPLPERIYDTNKYNDFIELLNPDLLKYDQYKKNIKLHKLSKVDCSISDCIKEQLDVFASWYPGYIHLFDRPKRISNLLSIDLNINVQNINTEILTKFKSTQSIDSTSKQLLEANIKKYLIPLIDKFPHINFNIILMPKVAPYEYVYINEHFYALDELTKHLSDKENINTYAFGNQPWLKDFRLWRDHYHFHPEVSRYVMMKISKNENNINKYTLNKYKKSVISNLSSWQIPENWLPAYKDDEDPDSKGLTDLEVARIVYNEPKMTKKEFDKILDRVDIESLVHKYYSNIGLPEKTIFNEIASLLKSSNN
nr:hypothetical protein [Alphaproteobacteria bacterium]